MSTRGDLQRRGTRVATASCQCIGFHRLALAFIARLPGPLPCTAFTLFFPGTHHALDASKLGTRPVRMLIPGCVTISGCLSSHAMYRLGDTHSSRRFPDLREHGLLAHVAAERKLTVNTVEDRHVLKSGVDSTVEASHAGHLLPLATMFHFS
jgi:hypothetical protein